MWITSGRGNAIAGSCFNRYMVECEYTNMGCFVSHLHRFNRYMVECEFVTQNEEKGEPWRFNRYMVECEYTSGVHKSVDSFVLIDTWWNVNSCYSFQNQKDHTVLIDTWWNVNKFFLHLSEFGLPSFNRYMVECEWWKDYNKNRYRCRFNRYMVECES